MKAKQCDECKHFDCSGWASNTYCTMGHKPRFYQPKSLSDAHGGDWGFKRKCSDFEGLRK